MVEVNMRPNDAKVICGQVSSLALQALAVARAIQATPVPRSAFAQIGQAAADASGKANQEIGNTVQALSTLLQTINNKVVQAANGVPATSAVAPGTPLATSVRLAGAGLPAEPHSVEHVLNSVTAGNPVPGQIAPPGAALASPASFTAWMASPQNQAALGLTQVGTGPGSFLAMRPGDVVVGALRPGDQIIAILGDDGNLYNGGPVGPAAALADVRGVYRLTTSQTTLWS